MFVAGPWPCLVGASAAGLLAILLVWKRSSDPFSRAAIVVLGVLAWIHVSNAMAMGYGSKILWWRQMALLGEMILPVSLSYLTLGLAVQAGLESARQRRRRCALMLLAAMGLAVAIQIIPHGFMQLTGSSEQVMFVDPWGRMIWGAILLGLVWSLADLEHFLRALRDPLRYQLKFILIGFGGIAGVAIAQATQLLLLPVWNMTYAWVNGLATALCVGLMTIGFARWRVREISQKLTISHQALYTSLTFFLVGGYLIFVGVVAEVIRRSDWAIGEALGLLVFFVAAVGLVTVAVSRQARMGLKQFVGRHFLRSKHDYRAKWLEMTEAFAACETTDQILDQYLLLLSRTFGAPRIGIWMRFEVDGRYHQVRTVNTEPAPYPLDSAHPLLCILREQGEPVQFLHCDEEQNPVLREFLHLTKAILCVPLQTRKDIIGFVTLSSEAQGRPYEVDDVDLCRVMAYHVAMLLVQAKLMEDRAARAKWDAVTQFAAFYIHDLKNLAGGLSLVVQNAQEYGHDPEFHESVIRTVARTAHRMTELMKKLSDRLKGSAESDATGSHRTNVNAVIQDTLELMNGQGVQPIAQLGSHLAPVALMPEQLKQVLLNLLVNAQQAVQGDGVIEVRTEQCGKTVLLTIKDTGPGIPPARLASLFHPFQSTKESGMGIGLYQCKEIIERYHGSIRIESQEGRGTCVIITLPTVDGESS
ncbi:MAG: PEP-CTERM system histidine kinase PrsK [Nitrospirae bacterium]|nr:MAG: PEP-CTERM system histidine kinase PrsK [Nitrospirota bacterium]